MAILHSTTTAGLHSTSTDTEVREMHGFTKVHYSTVHCDVSVKQVSVLKTVIQKCPCCAKLYLFVYLFSDFYSTCFHIKNILIYSAQLKLVKCFEQRSYHRW